MKFIILLASLFIFNYANSQTLIKKDYKENQFIISDSVTVENGHNEKIKVFFILGVPKDMWNKFLAANNSNEQKSFELMAGMLSVTAKSKLKNPESFNPLTKQLVTWNDGFYCNYNMVGRNSYGNITETKVLITYNPFN